MNRQRCELQELCRKFFDRAVAEGIERGLISPDHFTADGTLIRSLASQKSLKPIGGKGDDKHDDNEPGGRDTLVEFRGQKRSNATHRSTTGPEARLARKGLGKESPLCHSGHVLMENRSGLCLAVTVDTASGHAERRNALRMLRHVERRHGLTPRTVGYGISQRVRKRVEQIIGWGKTIAGLRPVRGAARA